MRRSIATVSVGGTLEQKLDAVAAAGFDGIELFDNDLISSTLTPRQVAERCADLGLRIDLFQPVRDVEGTPPELFGRVLHRVRAKFAVMAELGVSDVLLCSNCLPEAVPDPDLMAEQLSAVGDLAADAGITVGYEALAWGRTTSRFGQAWDVVQRAGHPHVGVVVDTFHMLSRGDGPEALAGVPGDRIAFLQIADAPRLGMDVLDWSRHFRCFPGQGNLPVAPLVADVVARGYRGPLSLEVFSDVVREADPGQTALDAMRSLLFLEEELRAVWTPPAARPAADGTPAPEGTAPDRTAAARPVVELVELPPAPTRVDAGFVEVALGPDPSAAEDFERTLRALGFGHVGTHRGLPVHWWANGAANIVLNAASSSRPLSVTALGAGVPEVSGVAARAGSLLWPKAHSRRRPDDAPLPGLHTPGGLDVFLCEGDRGTGWQVDFVPTGQSPAGTALGIDHIGASIEATALPAEQSFFRTVLGLQAGALTEFMQPGGRMRSRPLSPDRGDLRVIVSVDDGTRPTEARRGFNQVAVAVPDVFAVAEAAHTAGVPLMPVPDNYYVDLAARFDLDPALLDRLRRHGILYDRSGTGELFHLYTPILGNGFYLEVLQRAGGYDGFGAPNTHVRLAAHARQLEG